MNDDPLNPVTPATPPELSNDTTNTLQPDNPQPPEPQPPTFNPGNKSSKKKTIALAIIALVVVAAAGAAFFLSKNKSVPVVSKTSGIAHLTLPNQPKQLNDQFGTQYLAAGYVNYAPTKFKKVPTTLPKLTSIVPAVSGTTDKEVVFITDLTYEEANNSKQLLMYDVASQLTYVVATDNSVGTYVNPKIMSDHYVVYAAINQTDPLTNNTVIRITDLNTGDTKTILSDKGANLPASFCCAVSPDGLRLVIPQTNKFLIYQAGEAAPTSFAANVQVFPKTIGNDNSDYAASQRNYGYPAIVWLDDNRFMYAKAQPEQFKVDSTGTHAEVNNNGLAVYDLSSGTSTDVAKTNTIPIKWFSVDGTNVVFAGYKSNVSGLTDSNSGIIIYNIPNYKDSSPQALELASQTDNQSIITYSASTKDVYVQPKTLDSYGSLNGPRSTTLQTINISSGTVGSLKINGFAGADVQGMIGPHQLVLDTSSAANTIYNIYDINSGTSLQIFNAPKNK